MTSGATSQVLLLNGACHLGCTHCATDGQREVSVPDLPALVAGIPRLTNLYVGVEAFEWMELLPVLIRLCRSKDVRLHLCTYGQCFENAERAVAALAELQQHGPFAVLTVCDRPHWDVSNRERFADWLRATRRTGLFSELLYLRQPQDSIPPSLAHLEELNLNSTIYCRDAGSLLAFIQQKHWPVIGPDRVLDTPIPASADNPTQVAPDAVTTTFPMYFNSLVLETTHFCNARCSHCYTSCGPDAPTERMPLEAIKRVVSEAASLPNLLKRCHVGGGEATIFWGEMLEILRHAKSNGFRNSIVTNGWWARSLSVARSRLSDLKSAGVYKIELSVDAMHQTFVSIPPVLYVIRAAKEYDVKVALRICTTRSHRADAVLDQLPGEDQGGTTVAISRVTPIGRAKGAIPIDDIFLDSGLPNGSCNRFLNLTVTPNGDVFPCCAGSETCSSLKLGNAFERPLSEIMTTLQGNYFVRALVHAGPAYFAMLLDEAGLSDRLSSKYSNICHLCNQICSDDELSAVVHERLSEKIRGIIPAVAGDMAL